MPPRCTHLRRCAILLIAMGAIFILQRPRELAAQTSPSPFTPYEHRALYLYNFAKFITWPQKAYAGPHDPFVIGILGVDPFGKDINIIKGKSVHGRTVSVRYFSAIDKVDHCHILFVSDSEKKNIPAILKAMEDSSIVSVAEAEGFVDAGGMIGLALENQTLAFEINQEAGERRGLRFDSRLLRLARRVKQ